jgi:hypothetical protein
LAGKTVCAVDFARSARIITSRANTSLVECSIGAGCAVGACHTTGTAWKLAYYTGIPLFKGVVIASKAVGAIDGTCFAGIRASHAGICSRSK